MQVVVTRITMANHAVAKATIVCALRVRFDFYRLEHPSHLHPLVLTEGPSGIPPQDLAYHTSDEFNNKN